MTEKQPLLSKEHHELIMDLITRAPEYKKKLEHQQEMLELVKLQRSKCVVRALQLIREGALLPADFAFEPGWAEPDGGLDDIFQREVYRAEAKALVNMISLNPEAAVYARGFDPIREFWRILEEDWFVEKAGYRRPLLRAEDEMEAEDGEELLGAAIPDFNAIFYVKGLSPSLTFSVLVHELTHLLVEPPYPAHGRLFCHTHAWIWSHLDQRFGTNQAELLVAHYEQIDVPYMPLNRSKPVAAPGTLREALSAHPFLDTEDLTPKGGCFWIYDTHRTDSPILYALADLLQSKGINAKVGRRQRGRGMGECGVFLPRYSKDRKISQALIDEILGL